MGKKKLKDKKMAEEKDVDKKTSSNSETDLYSQIFAEDSDSEAEEEKSVSTNVNRQQQKVKRLDKSNDFSNPSKSCPKGKSNSAADASGSKRKNDKPEKRTPVVPAKLLEKSDDSSDSEAGEYEFDDGNMDDDDEELEEEEEEKEEEEDSADSEDESESDSEKYGGPKTALRRQLKDLSFEELESLKQKMGLKEYNEAMFACKSRTSSKNKKKRKFERVNKHRPREISSKVRVPKLRQVVKVPKKITKDPRFDNSCGEFNEKIWNTEYGFIRDIQKTEAEDMKKKIKFVGDKAKRQDMRRFIQKVSDKEKSIAVKQQEEQKRKQDKEENRKRMEEGKRPFYVKKSTKKLMELVEKYDELKASGRLEKYLKKKRKKNAFRDKKTLTG